MLQDARLLKAAKTVMHTPASIVVFVNIRNWTCIEHQTGDAFFSQNFGGHPARMARPNN
jgi:hypothetical protein